MSEHLSLTARRSAVAFFSAIAARRRVQDHAASGERAAADSVRAEDGLDPPARGSTDPPQRTAAAAAGGAGAVADAHRRWRPTPPPTGDLTVLITDADARIRRRAALALGRVGLAEAVTPLTGLLADTDAEVRQVAAFALGLIGDASAAAALTPLLTDPAPMVRGRAAEALGPHRRQRRRSRQSARSPPNTCDTPRSPRRQPDDESASPRRSRSLQAGDLRARSARRVGPAGGSGDRGRPPGHALVAGRVCAAADQRSARAAGAQAARRRAGQVPDRLRGSRAGRVTRITSAGPAIAPAPRWHASARGDGLGDSCGAARSARKRQWNRSGASPAIAKADPNLRLEAVSALGSLKGTGALAVVQDLMTDPWPVMRIAATTCVGGHRPGDLRGHSREPGCRSGLDGARRIRGRARDAAGRHRHGPRARDARATKTSASWPAALRALVRAQGARRRRRSSGARQGPRLLRSALRCPT